MGVGERNCCHLRGVLIALRERGVGVAVEVLEMEVATLKKRKGKWKVKKTVGFPKISETLYLLHYNFHIHLD